MTDQKHTKDYEKVYEEFWKDIVEKDGVLNKEQIMKELSDFSFVMDNASKVYDYATGSKTANIMVDKDTIYSLIDDNLNEITDDLVADATEDLRTQLTKVTKQRDELREALETLLNAYKALPATDGRVIGLIPLFSICEKALALTKTKESV